MNKMVVFVGPRGSGKDTLVKYIVDNFDKCDVLPGYTTRPMRPGEKEGVHYFFTTSEDFISKADKGFFIEWNKHFDAYYGTPLHLIEDMWEKEIIPITDTDYKGASILKKKLGDLLLVIFVKASSFDILEKRIKERGIGNKKLLEKQLQDARDRYEEEIKYENQSDVVIVNDNLETATARTQRVLKDFLSTE